MKNARKSLAAALGVALLCGATALAGYNFEIYGVKVSVSCPAYVSHDTDDDTVTVEPVYDWCTIKVTNTMDGYYFWGTWCDVFILANDMIVKSITMKGISDSWFYTVGQTYDCLKFKGTFTNSGNTDAYGMDVGLGMHTAQQGWVPDSVSLKYGAAFAGLLGNAYFSKPVKGPLDDVLPEAGLKLLLDR